MQPRAAYTARINRVDDHIDAHLADPLDLATLAEVAHFSPWHFHRVFQAFTGETLADRVRRRRLEAAALRLMARPPPSALAVALDVGFGSAAVFTRAFKAHFGVTPTAWRDGGWRDWAARRRGELRKIHQADRNPDQALDALFRDDADSRRERRRSPGAAMNVTIKTIPDTRVAYMRHTGPYGSPRIGRLWQRFEAWCRAQGLLDGTHALYGISQDSPDLTPPDKLRYDACIAVDAAFRPAAEVGAQTLRGGPFAGTSFRGTGAEIHGAWMRLYGEWLPASGWQADERPALELYGTAIELDAATGVFACELALPVRAL
jgi:AraC family transcriptional regulator